MVFDKQHLTLFVALAFLLVYANATPATLSNENNVERLRGDLHQFIEMIISCLTNTKMSNHSKIEPSQLHKFKQITNSLQEDVGLTPEASPENAENMRKFGVGDVLQQLEESSSEGPPSETNASSESRDEPNNNSNYSRETTEGDVDKDATDAETNHDHDDEKSNRREFDIKEGDSHGFTPRTSSIETTDSESVEKFGQMSTTSPSIINQQSQDGSDADLSLLQSESKEDTTVEPSLNQQLPSGRKAISGEHLGGVSAEHPGGSSGEHQGGASAEHPEGASGEHSEGASVEHPEGASAEHPEGVSAEQHPGGIPAKHPGSTSAEHSGALADHPGGGASSSKEESAHPNMPIDAQEQSIEDKLQSQFGKIHKNLSNGNSQHKQISGGRKNIGEESTSSSSNESKDKSENNTEEIQVRNLIKEAPKFATGSSVSPYEALHIYGVQTNGPINKIVFEGGEHHPPRPLTVKESNHLKEFIRMVIKTNKMHSPMATFPVDEDEISSRSGFSENYTKKSPWAEKPLPLELV